MQVGPAGQPHPAPLRLLVVAGLVAGLIAMHHLGGGAHRAGHTTGSEHSVSTAADTTTHDPPARSAGGAVSHTRQPVEPTLTSMSNAAARASALTEGSASGVCLAVLLAGIVLLVLSTGRSAPLTATSGRGWRVAASPLGRGPPRLLLARLCVLRM